jgi:glycosyltransferase involved in cell wall biosynthesis
MREVRTEASSFFFDTTRFSVSHFGHFLEGGAGIAMLRLHQGLLAAGVPSQVWYGFENFRPVPEGVKRYVSPSRPPGSSAQRWTHRLHRIKPILLVKRAYRDEFSIPVHWRRTEGVQVQGEKDIIHLHWITLMFDPVTFLANLPRSHPIVWTLHDENPFTGGCHYSWGCRGFVSQCSPCPQLRWRLTSKLSRTRQQRMEALLTRFTNLHVAADSRWLASQAASSSAFHRARSVRPVHYGLDHQCFRPTDKTAAREGLGLSSEDFVMCFGAQTLSHPRKGGHILKEACRAPSQLKNAVLLLFGRNPEFFRDLPLRCIHAGPDVSPARLVDLYNASDVFVMPSLEEAFGQTGLESLACGTPVLGSRTGGIVDFVIAGETGLQFPPGDAGELRAALEWCRTNKEAVRNMGKRGRQLIVEHFTLAHQAQAYTALYTEITKAAPQ